MKKLPALINERNDLNLRLGIKSSFSKLRQSVSLLYLLYVTNNRQSNIIYSKKYEKGIVLNDEQVDAIRNYLGNDEELETTLNQNPLLTSQLESIQVGIELFFRLAKVKFIDNLSNSIERTGGERFEKKLYFSLNTNILDLLLKNHPENTVNFFLKKWLTNQPAGNQIENDVINLLTIFTEETKFKLRTESSELIFQQEGIYNNITNNEDVIENRDIRESVGPFRVLNSFVKESLHYYLVDEDGFKLNPNIDYENFKTYKEIVSNTLDILPNRISIELTDTLNKENNSEDIIENTDLKTQDHSIPLQQIYYGAPGTGKSHIIKKRTSNAHVIRTTFHPDSDYSTFVGCYKPTTKEEPRYTYLGEKAVSIKDYEGNILIENHIIYEFVDQAFLQAYIQAWKFYIIAHQEIKNQYLVIEEINRGNCAQIFGDLFQLLDRNHWGFSDYPILADNDIHKRLAKAFNGLDMTQEKKDAINAHYDGKDIVSEVLNGKTLLLPNNLYILATMNTSDQSLFPIDSAFKRRWDWQYMPICKGRDNGKELKWTIAANTKAYDWWSFLNKINELIALTTSSEDKKLGFFFCKAIDGCISAETFVGKVIFYLWNDVFKDFGFDNSIFYDEDGTTLSFEKFYSTDATGQVVVQKNKLELFLSNLDVEIVNDISSNYIPEEQ